jgi:PAS domain S-box-containing protein
MSDLDHRTLTAILRSSDDAIVTKTTAGIVTSWNPAAERIFGYASTEIIGRPITVLFPPERLSEEAEFLRRIATGQRVDHFETVRIRKDGTRVDISVTLSPILDSAGRIVGISKIARDITERKRMEAERQAREELFRITLSSIGDAVVTTDNQGRVTFVNPTAETLTGWPNDEAVGQPITQVFNIVSEASGRPLEDPISRVLREGMVVGLANHTALIARDSTIRPIADSAAPIRDSQGCVYGVVLVFRDITERRGAEIAAQRLAAIVRSSDDAIVGKTLDGIITSWNPAAERMFGYPADEAVGKSITLIVPLERLEEEEEVLRRVRRGETVAHFETVRVAKDGTRLEISLTVSPIRDSEGTIVGASKIARDITGRRAADETIRQHRDAIRELSTPVLRIRERLLILPMIGEIDTERARQLTDQLLSGIRFHRAKVVVIDMTGVGALSATVAQQIISAGEACRLLGASIIMTGLSHEIADTLVRVGVDLARLTTLGDLQSGIEVAEQLLKGQPAREPSLPTDAAG